MWKKLLLPHDFSSCAARALHVAAGLAKVHRAEITLLHVSELPENLSDDALVEPPGAHGVVRIGDYTTQGALHRLEAIAEPLRAEGLSVAVKAVTGEIATAILRATDELGADVLVVGTHGRTGIKHFILGSVAESLVRRASVPVLCVRTPSEEAEHTAEERTAEDELAG